MSDERDQELSLIASEVRVCTDCELHRGRTLAVPGDGASDADVVFIGEAPGMNEDKQGLPFVGNSGKFLNDMLESIGWDRESVFITNIVKCRPPGNRDPLPDEIEACSQYLDRQIELLDPKMIVTLGRHSMSRWFGNERISRIHGKHRTFDNRVVVPMYHPAAALHQPSLRAVVQADFKKLPLILEEAMQGGAGQEDDENDAEQMSLF
ncbi:MAG: uracil-DNA glycosylase [Thermomicrobiales bacterium]